MRQLGFPPLTEVVKNLVIINVLFFIATLVFAGNFGINLRQILGLHLWFTDNFQPFQIVTHMFMHGDSMHILFNMFMLWMFGSMVELRWGPKRFLFYYLFTGLGAALLYSLIGMWDIYPTLNVMDQFIEKPTLEHLKLLAGTDSQYFFANFKNGITELASNGSNESVLNAQSIVREYRQSLLDILPPVVGASGAVYGLLLAVGMLFPNQTVLVYFLFPIKMKYLVIIMGVFEFYLGIQNNPADNTAHFAHLGGMLFGLILLMYWHPNAWREMFRR